jgi:hypothetical protein
MDERRFELPFDEAEGVRAGVGSEEIRGGTMGASTGEESGSRTSSVFSSVSTISDGSRRVTVGVEVARLGTPARAAFPFVWLRGTSVLERGIALLFRGKEVGSRKPRAGLAIGSS